MHKLHLTSFTCTWESKGIEKSKNELSSANSTLKAVMCNYSSSDE